MRFICFILIFALARAASAAVPVEFGVNDSNTIDSSLVYALPQVASNTLKIVKRRITPNTYSILGFASMSEALNSTSGSPMALYSVNFTQLQAYQQGQDLATLVNPINRVIVPIMAGTNVRSSFILRLLGKDTWTNENVGMPRTIQRLAATAKMIPQGEIKPNSQPFAVEVPVFNMWFLGHQDPKDVVVFRAIDNLAIFGVISNKVVPTTVLSNIAAKAKVYTGPP
jgi:hypothetical protein